MSGYGSAVVLAGVVWALSVRSRLVEPAGASGSCKTAVSAEMLAAPRRRRLQSRSAPSQSPSSSLTPPVPILSTADLSQSLSGELAGAISRARLVLVRQAVRVPWWQRPMEHPVDGASTRPVSPDTYDRELGRNRTQRPAGEPKWHRPRLPTR